MKIGTREALHYGVTLSVPELVREAMIVDTQRYSILATLHGIIVNVCCLSK